MIVVVEFARPLIQGYPEKFGLSRHFFSDADHYYKTEAPFLILGEHEYFGFEGAGNEVLGCSVGLEKYVSIF